MFILICTTRRLRSDNSLPHIGGVTHCILQIPHSLCNAGVEKALNGRGCWPRLWHAYKVRLEGLKLHLSPSPLYDRQFPRSS